MIGQAWRWARVHWAVLLGVVAVAGLVLAVGPQKVAAALDAADPRLLALMLPCALLLYLVHGLAWWAALRGVGADVSVRQAITTTYVSQALVLLPGGDLWRVPLLKHAGSKTPAGLLTGAVVFDDLSYLLVLTSLMVPGVVLEPSLWPYMAGLLVPQTVFITLLLWRGPQEWLLRRLRGLPLVGRFGGELAEIGPAFGRVARSRAVPAILGLQAVCAVLAVALFSLGVEAVHGRLPIVDVAFTYAGGQVAASVTVFPAALGIYEGLMTGLLAAQGVPAAAAAVAALLYRFFNDLVMAVAGLAVAALAEMGNRRGRRPLSWQVLRLGRPVLVVWEFVEWFTARRLRLRHVRSGGILRCAEAKPGDRLLELHLDNPRLVAVSAAGPWAMLRELRLDLTELAGRLAAGEWPDVVAVHGTTLLAAAGPRLGFELRPLRMSPSLRLHRFFFVGLVALHNPAGWRAASRGERRWPAELWMSRETLLARYLTSAVASSTDRGGPSPLGGAPGADYVEPRKEGGRMPTKITPRRRVTARPVRSGVHRGTKVPPAPPLTAEQRHDLEDLDDLLTQLIRQNRRLRAQIDKVAHALTTVGEDQIDGLLKTVRQRLRARTRPVRPVKATPRRRVSAA